MNLTCVRQSRIFFMTAMNTQDSTESSEKKWRKESMKYEVNECCNCAAESSLCVGNSCPMRHVTYYRCDRCGCDGLTEDEIHEVDGEFLEEGEEHD